MTTPTTSNQSDVITVRPIAKSNRLTSIVLAACLLISACLVATFLPPESLPIAAILLVFSILVTIIAAAKCWAPTHSFLLTKQQISHYQSKGSWQLCWQHVERIDQPRVQEGLALVPLPYLGFRLSEQGYDQLLTSISPRLAGTLLVQQRALLLQQAGCESGECYTQGLLENEQYTSPMGTHFTGIKGMLGNRMVRLRNLLGYEIFVEIDQLDRNPSEFIRFINECRQAVG